MTSLTHFLQGKKHIIWDWNGTLFNDVDHAVSTMNGILTARGLPPITRDHYRQIFEFPVINYYRALGFAFEQESFETLSHEFVRIYMEGFRGCPLIEGTENLLKALHEQKMTQSILSAADQGSLDEMVLHFGLDKYFFSIRGVENKLATSKVQKGWELMDASSHTAAETILIGDTEHDLEVGKSLGIDVILVGHGHQCPTRLKRIHDKVMLVAEIQTELTRALE